MTYAIGVTLLVTCQPSAWRTNTLSCDLSRRRHAYRIPARHHSPERSSIAHANSELKSRIDRRDGCGTSEKSSGVAAVVRMARGWSGSKITIITKKLLAPIGNAKPSISFPLFFPFRLDSTRLDSLFSIGSALSRCMRTSGRRGRIA